METFAWNYKCGPGERNGLVFNLNDHLGRPGVPVHSLPKQLESRAHGTPLLETLAVFDFHMIPYGLSDSVLWDSNKGEEWEPGAEGGLWAGSKVFTK